MRRYLILAVVIVLVMGAGIAIAQVGGDGVIYACADNKDGSLRLAAGPDDCDSKKEASVFWNQQGIPGVDGQDGVDGADGADGADGIDGNLALAGQGCTEEGESVIGFDENGDIVCEVGGVTTTTTTTTTLPPDYFDLTGEWIVTEIVTEHACADVAPEVGDTVLVDHSDALHAIWSTSEGDWEFYDDLVDPIADDDEVSEVGHVFTPNGDPIESELSAVRYLDSEWMYIVTGLFEWGNPSCEGYVDFHAER